MKTIYPIAVVCLGLGLSAAWTFALSYWLVAIVIHIMGGT
jgi:hypothetical protein